MDLRRATKPTSTTGSNAPNQQRSAVQTFSPSVTSVSTSFRGRRNQQQPEETASSISSRGRRNQQQSEETASSISLRGRHQQQPEETTTSSHSSSGRRNQQHSEETVRSISLKRRRHQQQREETTTSSHSSRGRRNQQQPESAVSSTSSVGRRNQQQPEETASSMSSRGRRNQQRLEDVASRTNSRGRRNQQHSEETSSRISSRGSRNQQQPEDTGSSTNTRGRRREHQRIVDYSSNLSAIYGSEASDDTNDQYDEASAIMLETSDSADEDDIYRIDDTEISLDVKLRASHLYKTAQIIRIYCTLVYTAVLLLPAPHCEFFGTYITFNLGVRYFFTLTWILLMMLHHVDMFNQIRSQSGPLRPFKIRYEDNMVIFVVIFIFRISTELRYPQEASDSDYLHLVMTRFGNRMAVRDCGYLIILQALLIWINKVLPVAYKSLETFALSSILDYFFIFLLISMDVHQIALSEDDVSVFDVIASVITPALFLYINKILMPVMYVGILYILIKRFRFRSMQLSDEELTQNWDLEVNFGSLSIFDKFITLFIILLPFIFFLDRNYISPSGGMFQLNQDHMNYFVNLAVDEYDFIQIREEVTMNKISTGNNLLTSLDDLLKEMTLSQTLTNPALEEIKDSINNYLRALRDWIEHLEEMGKSLVFDQQKQADRIEDWIGQLQELKTIIEVRLFGRPQ